MVWLNEKKFACSTCIKGHRSSTCNHSDRPLFAIRAKGRPVSQCDHCRELRKTKQVHVKCECNNSRAGGSSGAGGDNPESLPPGTSMIVARKGAKKIKTLEPATATFPNGINDLVAAAQLLSSMSDGTSNNLSPASACTCDSTGVCDCCTARYIPKSRRASSTSRSHSARPSISLSIPEAPDAAGPSSSPIPLNSATGTRSPGNRSPAHSRSPSRSHQHHAVDGHQVEGAQSDHISHRHHASLYSPYPTSAGSANSPNGHHHLAPPSAGDWRDASNGGSLPPSPLSADLDRPHSALSTGRNSPVDYSAVGSFSLNANTDWEAQIAAAAGSLNVPGTSPSLSHGGDPFGSQVQQLQLNPNSAFGTYRTQDGLSPVTPSSPFMESRSSPVVGSYSPYNTAAPAFPAANLGGNGEMYGDVFLADDDQDVLAHEALLGISSRRGSHVSVSSSPGSHHGFGSLNVNGSGSLNVGSAPEIRLMSASPQPPQPVIGMGSPSHQYNSAGGLQGFSFGQPSPPGSVDLGNSSSPSYSPQPFPQSPQPSADRNINTCANAGKGCHCWSPGDTHTRESRRCNTPGCPCCSYPPDIDISGLNDLNMGGLGLGQLAMMTGGAGTSDYATSNDGGAYGSNSNIPSIFDNPQQPSAAQMFNSLSIPSGGSNLTRSRSSSASSHHATSDPATPMSGMGGSNLGRHNSTGQLGHRGGRFKPILPKPVHPHPQVQHTQTEPLLDTSNPQAHGFASGAGGGWSFPSSRASPQPTVVVTEHHNRPQPHPPSFTDMINSTAFDMDDLFARPASSHNRNLSHPMNLQSFATEPQVQQQHLRPQFDGGHSRSISHSGGSGLLEPRPTLPGAFGGGHSRSISEGGGAPELIVTPASPFRHAGWGEDRAR